MKAFSKQIIFAVVTAGAALVQSPAMAACDLSDGGFLAAAGKCLVPSAAPVLNAADRIHGQIGRPLDQAAQQVLTQVSNGGGFQPVPQYPGNIRLPQVQQMQMGVFCHTAYGRFGPGPLAPIGAPCPVLMPFGMAVGSIGN